MLRLHFSKKGSGHGFSDSERDGLKLLAPAAPMKLLDPAAPLLLLRPMYQYYS